MPRAMSSDLLAAIQASLLRPAIFVDITFADGTVFMWSGSGPITIGGHTWLGVGSFGGISVIEENTNVEARGITLTLSGIDSAMLAEALQQIQIGQPVTVWIGFYDPTNTFVIAPIPAWSGRVDQPTIELGGDKSVISLNAENILLSMNVATDRRYTLEDSQINTPGELGFQFVNSISEITLYWGSQAVASQNV